MASSDLSPRLYAASSGYHDALLASLECAKSRILLETMDFDTVDEMAALITACEYASQRGVRVTLIYDIHSYSNVVREHTRAGLAIFRAWERHAATTTMAIHTVGARGINPFAGRHHAKIALIDDHVYIGGGVNLTASSFATRDFMLRYDDARLAQTLYETLPRAALERTSDKVVYDDEMSEVLLDAGIRGASLIYSRVCELARQATKVWYVSKLAPDGELVHILQPKDTTYWYNSVTSSISFDKLAVFIDQIRMRVPNNYTGHALLHAKFCVFEMPDGSRHAITGSHNFNSRGVAFGTQELAIHTKDQALCENLIEFAHSL